MTAFYSGLASQTGNTALANANANLQQMLSTEQSKGDATRQYQLQTASELLDEQTALLSDDLFARLESLLDLILLLLINAVHPFRYALKRHRRIYELYRAGKIAEEPVETPVNDLLEVADNSLNEGLRNSISVFGILLLAEFLWRWRW